MRAIVTGGGGFIGSHLVERLHGEGHDVLVVDSLASGTGNVALLESLSVSLDTTDIRQDKLIRVIETHQPRVVFHLAAQASVGRSVADPIADAKVNLIGTLRVLAGVRAAGARIVFTSSGGTIYGEPDPSALPITEETQGRPVSPYGIAKRASEDYLRFYASAFGVPFASLAPANVYGPRQDPLGESGVIAIFASQLLKGEECVINGDGKHTRDFVYVSDLVDAFMAASDRGEGETMNVGTGTETTIETLYAMLAKECGVQRAPRHGPERAGDVRRSALSNEKAKRILGWEPKTSLSEGLRLTVDWFRSNL